jgi:hypothetical protein
MKKSSQFNREILGKRLRNDAGKWDAPPSPESSQQTLRAIRQSFREAGNSNRPALFPVFAACMALALIFAVTSTFKPPAQQPQTIQSAEIPSVPTPADLVTLLPDSPFTGEIHALEEDVLDTVDFLLGLVPDIES